MAIRTASKGTQFSTGESVKALDLNDTITYAIGQMENFQAVANSALSLNNTLKLMGTNPIVKGSQNYYSFSNTTGGTLFSALQKINIGSSPFNQLQSVLIGIGIPYDGYTLSYSTYAEIFLADGSGNPTGSALATSNTIAASNVQNFSVTYVFSTPITLSANTNYVISFRNLPKKTGSNNYFTNLYYDTADTNFYKLSSTNNNTYDITGSYHIGNATFTYISSSVVVDKATTQYDWVGFAGSAVSTGALVEVKLPFGVVSGFSGLSVGASYYLAASGAISTVGNAYLCGVAISATKLLILRRNG